jgi:hypothetical protein
MDQKIKENKVATFQIDVISVDISTVVFDGPCVKNDTLFELICSTDYSTF